MKITPIIRAALVGALLSGVAAVPSFAAGWRGWNLQPEGYPNTTALEQFVKDVNSTTGGRLNAQVFNGGVLGDQPDAIEQVRAGALDFADFSMGPMGPIIPATNVLSLPYLFNGEDQMHRVMDGAIGKEFSAAMEKQGLVALAWFDAGARSFYNTKHPIETPADMKGLKLRVMENDLYVQMVAQLGGNATPMAYGEVYQSLKTGVIDGAENNFPSYDSSNHYQVAKYFSVDDHLIIPECLCVSKISWDKLSPADQAAVQTAATAAAKAQRDLWAKQVKASEAKMIAAGVKINEVKNKADFQKAMDPVYAKFEAANPDLKALIEEIKATK
ncbi:2,3-diketo-L-gulonate-binding periplasmic protein YiaO precursor [mine drainage metagenome]|uniref:2,3-diketo-L-gulonate-binding periplasmic protein YiaO n=1 Tax=mine drainage metagenome TaxID=410659 RepID=A0A1J5Q0W5_9ZZZZ